MNASALRRPASWLTILTLFTALILLAGAPCAHAHDMDDVVSFGRDAMLPADRQAESVVAIFGSAISEGEAGNIVSILGNARITGPVSEGAVAVIGNLYIDSKVDGDAVAVLGNLELGPNAQIEGDAISVGGQLRRDPAAVVHGQIENVFAGEFGEFDWLRTWVHKCLLYGRPLAVGSGLEWAWTLALAFLALYLAFAVLFREGLLRCVSTVETQPGQTFLAALLTLLLTPVLLVLLCITVIGIAAIPFVVAGLFCAALFGKAVMLAWLGRRIAGGRGRAALGNPALAVLMGGALVLLLYLIPVIGFMTYQLLGLMGLGAVVFTLISAARVRHTAPAAAAQPSLQVAPAAASEAAAMAPGPAIAMPPPSPPPPSPPPPPSAAPPESPVTPITAALPRAGFMRRMGALLIDFVLVGFVMSILNHIFRAELVVLATYGAIMWKMRGSTVGGLVLDLRVVRLDGREIDWPTAVVRALGCFLSLAVAGLGFFWIAFDPENQAWHDKIAGTVVVRVAAAKPLV